MWVPGFIVEFSAVIIIILYLFTFNRDSLIIHVYDYSYFSLFAAVYALRFICECEQVVMIAPLSNFDSKMVAFNSASFALNCAINYAVNFTLSRDIEPRSYSASQATFESRPKTSLIRLCLNCAVNYTFCDSPIPGPNFVFFPFSFLNFLF